VNTKIHHLNCGTMRPVGMPELVSHVLVVERSDGLVLVDTGFGSADAEKPKRFGRSYLWTVRPALDYAETAVAQIHRLGFTAEDVTDIVLTHMDSDHTGGLIDFPRARVHVDATELWAAERRSALIEKRRYLEQHWSHHPQWVRHGTGGDDWFGLTEVNAVHDDVVLIPLRGHTRGHCGVAVRRPDGGWLLHAGDSYFFDGEVATPPTEHGFLTRYQKVMAIDEDARRANLARVRELNADPEVTVFCSHDAAEFARLSGTGAAV
jgi:glyoxylase-like metal-dependent hydrolase (beta-lactamase superfamily II)